MRILHTSDCNLGQHFMGKSRQAEHQALIDWLLNQVGEYLSALSNAYLVWGVENHSHALLTLGFVRRIGMATTCPRLNRPLIPSRIHR